MLAGVRTFLLADIRPRTGFALLVLEMAQFMAVLDR